MREAAYQKQLMEKIRERLPGCHVFKTDPTQLQGIPDLLVLHNDTWGMLEVKMSEDTPKEPNQVYYVDSFHEMSFASFIHPGNEEEVLSELQRALGVTRETCVSQP
jgi:hypothetical protein